MYNFNTIFNKVFNACYKYLGFITLIVRTLYVSQQRSNFDYFQQFFYHNFRLEQKFFHSFIGKIQYRSIRIYPISILKNNFLCIQIYFHVKDEKFKFFYNSFFKLLPNFSDFINSDGCSDDCIVKFTLKSIRLYPVFIHKMS